MSSDGSRAATNRRAVPLFVVVTVALFMQSLDSTIVATALLDIQIELRTSLPWAGWTITMYAAAMMAALPLSANLCKVVSPKTVFVASLAVFTAASLACALAPNIWLLIAFRAVQAIGGAGLTPSATAVVVESFGRARDKALGLFGIIFQAGSIAGPVLGSVFVTYATWRWIFFVNVVVGVFVMLGALRVIPRTRPDASAATRSLLRDPSGLVLITVAVVSFMTFSILIADDDAVVRPPTYLVLVASIVVFFVFLRHVKRVERPFIQPRLITGRGFGAINVINVIHGGVPVGLLSLVPLYGMVRYHLSPLLAGGLLAASAAVAIVFGLLAVAVLRRVGYLIPLYVNSAVTIAGLAVLALPPAFGTGPVVWLIVGSGLLGAGRGISQPAARNAGMQLLPEEAAAIAALRTMGRRIGMVVAVAGSTAAASLTSDAFIGIAGSFGFFSAVVLVSTLAIRYVPDHRGEW